MTKLQRYKSIGLFTLMLSLTTTSAIAKDSVSDAALQHAKELLRSAPLIDGHNDLPWLIREENGGDVPAFRLEVENEFADCGLQVVERLGDVAGGAYAPDSTEFAVVAKAIG